MDDNEMNQSRIITSGSQVAAPEYQGHPVFQLLDNYVDFYKNWSFAVFKFVTLGTRAIANIDSYVFSSIQGTLCSIGILLKNGRINDAWTLLRKYNDSIIIDTYNSLFLKDNFSIDNFYVEEIDSWRSGKATLPEYRVMSRYIREHKELSDLIDLLYKKDKRYKAIRDRCNDHTHYNSFKAMLVNDNNIYLEGRISHLDQLLVDLRDLFILHISFMFCIREHYMASSDYADYLDCGDTPPEDSQYWVAPFIQEIFTDTLMQFREDIAVYIRGRVSMHLK